MFAAVNLVDYFLEPFWLRFIVHSVFFFGTLYLAARLQADNLVARPAWRYLQIAALCLCAWNITSLAASLLVESAEVGEFIRSTDEQKPKTQEEKLAYEGDRFRPLGAWGEVYYYLGFDVILLVMAGVFVILGLHYLRGESAGEEAEDNA